MSNTLFKELDQAFELITQLKDAGATIEGGTYQARGRKDNAEITNAELLVWFQEKGRDFISLTDEDKKVIDEVVCKEIKRRVDRMANREIKSLKNTLNSIFASAIRKGLFAIVSIIEKRIEAGVVAGGGPVRDLTEEYKKVKMRKHGFLYPVGVATGELLDSLQPDNKNIKIIK
jgi:hypothetical protein